MYFWIVKKNHQHFILIVLNKTFIYFDILYPYMKNFQWQNFSKNLFLNLSFLITLYGNDSTNGLHRHYDSFKIICKLKRTYLWFYSGWTYGHICKQITITLTMVWCNFHCHKTAKSQFVAWLGWLGLCILFVLSHTTVCLHLCHHRCFSAMNFKPRPVWVKFTKIITREQCTEFSTEFQQTNSFLCYKLYKAKYIYFYTKFWYSTDKTPAYISD